MYIYIYIYIYIDFSSHTSRSRHAEACATETTYIYIHVSSPTPHTRDTPGPAEQKQFIYRYIVLLPFLCVGVCDLFLFSHLAFETRRGLRDKWRGGTDGSYTKRAYEHTRTGS